VECRISMQTKIKNTVNPEIKPRVVRGRVELFVPYQNNEITFIYPSSGPDTYQNIGKEILQKKLILPHGDYTAALLYAAYCTDAKNEPEFANVRDIMNKRWLWVFNQNLWTDKGIYVVQDTQADGKNKSLSIKDLEKRLEGAQEFDGVRYSKDQTVRYAPKETYVLGGHTASTFAKDGFVRATAHQEGAQKLAEVAATFSYNPRTWGLSIAENDKAEQRVSALNGYDGDGLGLYGDFGDDGRGHAFGVSS